MEVIDGKGRIEYMEHKAGENLRNSSYYLSSIKWENWNLEKNILGMCDQVKGESEASGGKAS